MKRIAVLSAAALMATSFAAQAGTVGFDLPRLDFPQPPVPTTQGTGAPAQLPSR
ncbi:hypothetical protein [Actibacterium sp. 188UL27-1]|uniref:hypothetical protein n=1 Tax=Actibacterium sp. 188UL27-1 TaxID=2786961 RepID=UPI00195ACEF6|nr:hypothetical protein [Actibacterium sp. 188UL27-1]MBM7069857.1 hypothetical protein [Actibacterium sp. 188UL27-1]